MVGCINCLWYMVSLVSQLVKNLPTKKKKKKKYAYNEGDLGSVPGLGRSPGEVNGYPLQNSGLENSMGSQRVGQD